MVSKKVTSQPCYTLTNWHYKNNYPTLIIFNHHTSISRTNLESEVRFSESSFNFLQKSVLFCALYPHWYTAGRSASYNLGWYCHRLVGLKRLMMSQKKNLNLLFFWLFLWELAKTSNKLQFSALGKSVAFT